MTFGFAPDDGVVAHALVVVEIAAADGLGPGGPFSPGELAYAQDKSDPGRRLAARLAAKRAAQQALGGGFELTDVEVVRHPGSAPALRLSVPAQARLVAVGGARLLVSLTHGQTHAAAVVVALRPS